MNNQRVSPCCLASMTRWMQNVYFTRLGKTARCKCPSRKPSGPSALARLSINSATVMPAGWQIAPDKRASSDEPIDGGKPTSRYRSAGHNLDSFRIADHPPKTLSFISRNPVCGPRRAFTKHVAHILTDECLEKFYLTARARMGPSTARKST